MSPTSPYAAAPRTADPFAAPPADPFRGEDSLSVSAREAGRTGTELLVGIVERSEAVFRQLEELATRAGEVSRQADGAASELQERLRLGVRMLQAFDLQFARAEPLAHAAEASERRVGELAAGLEERIERRIAEASERMAVDLEERARRAREAIESLAAERESDLRERIGATVGELEERVRLAREATERVASEREIELRERIGATVAELEERVRIAREATERIASEREEELRERIARLVEETIEAQVRRLAARFDEEAGKREWRLGEIEGRARDLLHGLEHACGRADDTLRRMHETVGGIEHRLGEAERAFHERLDGLAGTVATGEAVRNQLMAEIAASAGRIDEWRHGAADAQRDLCELLEEARGGREELRRQVEGLDRIAGSARETVDLLGEAARRLEPWQPFLAGDRAAVTDAAETMVETISSGIRAALAADIRGFSHGLRSLASSAEQAFSSVRVDERLLGRTDRATDAAT